VTWGGESAIEDLITQARRGQLSHDGEAELRLRLLGSAEARLLYAAGQGFDRESSVLPGDEELAERFVARALARRVPRRSRWARALAAHVALGMLLGSSAAAAGWLAAREIVAREARELPARLPETARRAERARVHPAHAPGSAREPPPRSEASGAFSVERDAARGSAQNTLSFGPAAAPPPKGRTLEAKGGHAEVPPVRAEGQVEPACDALFAAANAARREGAIEHALELYGALQSGCARSPEAHQAALTRGMLELERGHSVEALRQFDGYVQRSGRQDGLLADAHWGRARALAELHRPEEERAAIETLLAIAPSSAYAEAARRRLVRLGQP
jgi:hypothetical protein